WVGQQVQLGTATVIPIQPCIRCTMVTRSQPGLDADVEIFRTLARHHHGHFGVWSAVLTPGNLSVGDRTYVVASGPISACLASRFDPFTCHWHRAAAVVVGGWGCT